ncbi:hypothetical protein IW18_04075 [Flavobacterium hibernum]|uniref:Uncharacterized protein n=1 Tax=Flavobacterium hibernum TaxID=37752 RepID=A0A0D0EFI9_9FLAO|nr:hypothetical protein IW18_04075 [Flavobacterium hibernum]OXA89711.1 hypothetical protein B0A73_04840 [Flavobacterium hibernum]
MKQFELFTEYFNKVLNSEYEFNMVVYIDNSVDLSYFKDLPIQFIINADHVLLSDVPPKMWRFYNIFFTKADVYLFRDSDSVISKRELSLLKIWFDSEYDYNVIRDTRLHLYPIMAGTFSVKQSGIELMKNVLSENPCLVKNRKHFYDQIYLAEILYPKIISNLLVFSNFLVFENEHYIKTDYRTKDFIGGYYLNNELETHWHDFKFIENFPLKSLKMSNYSTRLILGYISYILLKKRISFFK